MNPMQDLFYYYYYYLIALNILLKKWSRKKQVKL